jgi:excinuclease UvrABC nuclease subunit
MAKRMGRRGPISKKNIQDVPDQSGVYNLINRNGDVVYTGSAGAGRLKNRLAEHLTSGDIPGATHFQTRTTSSTREARNVEKQLIKRNQPRHNKNLK